MIITHNCFRLIVIPIDSGFQCQAIYSKFPPTEGETEELAVNKMKLAIDEWERSLKKSIDRRDYLEVD